MDALAFIFHVHLFGDQDREPVFVLHTPGESGTWVILELGCGRGTGVLARPIYSWRTNVLSIGIDISGDMVGAAKGLLERAQEEKSYPHKVMTPPPRTQFVTLCPIFFRLHLLKNVPAPSQASTGSTLCTCSGD
jgi:SAM-dependent methyltransferase